MNRITGQVETNPEVRDGRVRFVIVNSLGAVVRCRSAVECHAPIPRKGEVVEVMGEYLPRRRVDDFVYMLLERSGSG